MSISKEELKEAYHYFYKQMTLDKTDNDIVTDSITGLLYYKKAPEDIRTAKKQRALVFLVDEYRSDFINEWKDFLHFHFREESKIKARKLFREENLEGIDLLIKAYWGRTINLSKWQDIMNLISYKEYASNFCSAILLEKEKSKSLNEAFGCYGLYGNNEFLNKAVNYINENFNPTPFEKLKLFPGQTYLKDKELIALSKIELDRGNKKSELEYISFIRLLNNKRKYNK